MLVMLVNTSSRLVLFEAPRCDMLTGNSLASNSIALSNSAASSDEVPAVNRRDAPKRPVLQPKETAPPQVTYTLKNPKGQVCVRASLGAQYVVRENKVSLLCSQHFYSTSQHIPSRGENSLGLTLASATAHCQKAMCAERVQRVLGTTALNWDSFIKSLTYEYAPFGSNKATIYSITVLNI